MAGNPSVTFTVEIISISPHATMSLLRGGCSDKQRFACDEQRDGPKGRRPLSARGERYWLLAGPAETPQRHVSLLASFTTHMDQRQRGLKSLMLTEAKLRLRQRNSQHRRLPDVRFEEICTQDIYVN